MSNYAFTRQACDDGQVPTAAKPAAAETVGMSPGLPFASDGS